MRRVWKALNVPLARATVPAQWQGQESTVTGRTAFELVSRLWTNYGINAGLTKDVRSDVRRFGRSTRGGVRIILVKED